VAHASVLKAHRQHNVLAGRIQLQMYQLGTMLERHAEHACPGHKNSFLRALHQDKMI
jgi:hypothetical protein